MAISSFLRSIITNPNKITPKLLLKPSQTLITRPFSSTPSNPIAEPTQITKLDPLTKKPETPKPKSQNTIVEEFFKERTEGLFTSFRNAGKTFDKLSKRLRPFNNNQKFTHRAMDLARGHGKMPDEIAHIAVIEAYANAGLTNDNAHKVYLKMLGPGVIPNEHTYNMLVKLMASTGSGDYMMIGQAQKYLIEMLEKGMRPEAQTSVAIFKALAKEGRVREGKEFLNDIKGRGFVLDSKVFQEVVKGKGGAVKALKGRKGNVIRTVLEMLFGKKI